MVGLCFFFEPNDVDVWSGREIDLDAWNYAAKAAGDIDRVIVINRSGAKLRFDSDISFETTEAFPQLEGRIAFFHAPSETSSSGISLWTFDHAVDWYAFGPAAGWTRKTGIEVFVPTANGIPFHAIHAASIVMAHRYRVVSRGR